MLGHLGYKSQQRALVSRYLGSLEMSSSHLSPTSPTRSAGNASASGTPQHDKHFTIYSDKRKHGDPGSLVGLKLLVVLEELDLSCELICKQDVDEEPHQPVTLQGFSDEHLPVLIDHRRNNRAVWEANTILLYLTENYDPDHRISVADPKEKAVQLRWLLWQATCERQTLLSIAPMSNAVSDTRFNTEQYKSQARHSFSELENALSGNDWLVGGKCTIADLAFVAFAMDSVMTSEEISKDFPAVSSWISRLSTRASVRRVIGPSRGGHSSPLTRLN
ncbi:unnamed protein product [Somion occarium]|uniref:Glutathione S-transferase n=1 Tax=Somion occarium TaxID=3059160 RepID=A0ABP1DUS0_9APHY